MPERMERLFTAQYARVARLLARVVRDEGRAEELAVEVFLKFWQAGEGVWENPEGWLYRTAVRRGLNELRGEARRRRYEQMVVLLRPGKNPEEIQQVNEQQAQVRAVLERLKPRSAELLLLRSEGLSYAELAGALEVASGSVGTLLARAQEEFRKEYEARYGK